MSPKRLDALRKEVSGLNFQILALLNRRAQLSLKILAEKKRLEMEIPDPEREKQMHDDLTAANQGPFSDDAVAEIFQSVFNQSKKLMLSED